jgi:hypothetical protein
VDDGQRKSKRRALKKVLKRSSYRDQQQRQRDFYSGPILTIAEGRSRRHLNKVDYKFSAYDEQLQEAMDAIDSPPENNYDRPSGLGRGKDMATIIEADEKRRGSMDETAEQNDEANEISGDEQKEENGDGGNEEG